MRMVNGIEREMLQSEWENWLADENARCEQVRGVLVARERQEEGKDGKKGDGVEEKGQKVLHSAGGGKQMTTEALREWYDGYCGSCERDQRAVMSEGARRGLVM